jgi:hypothetical protein
LNSRIIVGYENIHDELGFFMMVNQGRLLWGKGEKNEKASRRTITMNKHVWAEIKSFRDAEILMNLKFCNI